MDSLIVIEVFCELDVIMGPPNSRERAHGDYSLVQERRSAIANRIALKRFQDLLAETLFLIVDQLRQPFPLPLLRRIEQHAPIDWPSRRRRWISKQVRPIPRKVIIINEIGPLCFGSLFALEIVTEASSEIAEFGQDHGLAGFPDRVLLHALPESQELVASQAHPRMMPAPDRGIFGWRLLLQYGVGN